MKVNKAGCILIDVNNNNVGLVYRNKKKDFSFPKGHLEDGETLEECAIRETEEELGRKCRIIASEPISILNYRDSLGDEVEVYYFLAIDEGPSLKKFSEDLVHEVVWKSIEDVEDTLSYPNLKEFWNKSKLKIIEILNNKFEKR